MLLLWKAEMVSNKNPEQLLIALEPEAASIHCREMKMREFANEQGDATVSDVFARPESKYLVIDIGGKIKLFRKMDRFDDVTQQNIKSLPYVFIWKH